MQRTASLGNILRAARERKGDSIHEAAAATGIAARYLAGLESEQFELLPARVYARAYLRSYAEYLALEPDPLVEQLDGLWIEPVAPEVIPVSRPLSIPPIITGQMLLIVAFLVLVGVLLGYVYSQYSSFMVNQPPSIARDATPSRPSPTTAAKSATSVPASPQAQPAPGQVGPPVLPEAAPPPQPTPTPVPAEPKEMKIEIRVTQKAWMNVEVDGKEVLNATLSPGDRYSWTAKERVFIWSGFAGGVQIIRNGVDEGPLGSGVVKMLWTAPTWKATPVND
ncbi:MAG: DUF4115 domain-containing protein [Actinobacteria bacterium]|nr:DUF4115 domain-containing protein [Actinomycetota bacterium]